MAQRWLGVLLCCGGIGHTGGCGASEPGWQPMDAGGTEASALQGTWENPATGHVIWVGSAATRVFHVLEDFCIRDNGVVPAYALFRFSEDEALLLHYFDYRARPDLLQAPLIFHRIDGLPEACQRDVMDASVAPNQVFAIIMRSFDRFYAFFEERGIDWEATKRRYAARAEALSSDEELFELLEEMLAPLGDGHVNLTWSDRSFNAGRPRLRERLRDAWTKSGSDLSEGAFVSAWHQAVLNSVYDVLDPSSLRSGAAGALEWGTIADTAGYVRVNRFTSFTQPDTLRAVQYDSLDAALGRMHRDLAAASILIVDVALNGGGSDAAAQLVASYFADRRRPALRYEAHGAPPQEIIVSPQGDGESRPVLLLTSEVTASAAESFVVMMRAFPHVVHVGGRTRGGMSSLLPKPFPNGFRVTLSYQRVLDTRGILYEATGIPPEHDVELFPDSNLTRDFAATLARLAGRQ